MAFYNTTYERAEAMGKGNHFDKAAAKMIETISESIAQDSGSSESITPTIKYLNHQTDIARQ